MKQAVVVLVLAALAVVPAQSGDDLKSTVQSLLKQLQDGPGDARRDAAEWGLLKLGPSILPLLEAGDKMPDAARERVAAIRSTLEELRPRTCTIHAEELPLAQVLEQIKKQAGLVLVDRRNTGRAGKVTVKLDKATYWEAVEAIVKLTGGRLSLYQPDGLVALVDGTAKPSAPPQVDLKGAFRVARKRITNKLDYVTGSHTGILDLEIAWEPRFAPYLIEVGKLEFSTPSPGAGPVQVAAGGPLPVTHLNAQEFNVVFPAPERSVLNLVAMKGSFVVTMPCKTLEFSFARPAQGLKQTKEGVQLSIAKLDAKDGWSVELTVDVPAAGPSFDSFQAWLGGSAWFDRCGFHFERGAGENKEVLKPDRLHTFASAASTPNRALVRFKVAPSKGAGDLSTWRLVCTVPGRMVEMTVPFAFEKIDLP
jgi:hypothetical protein